MNTVEFKTKIERDIETLKSLDFEIFERKDLYPEALKYIKNCYCKFIMSFFVVLLPSLLFHGNISHLFAYSGAFIVFALFLLLFHAIAFSRVTMYLVLKKMLFPKLEMGQFINQIILDLYKKMVNCFIALWGVYLLSCWIFGVRIDPEPVDFLGSYAFLMIITWLFGYIFIKNELNRLGVSAFFSLILAIVDKKTGGSGSSLSTEGYDPNKDNIMCFTDPRHLNPADPMNIHNSNNPSSYDYHRQHDLSYMDDYHRREIGY